MKAGCVPCTELPAATGSSEGSQQLPALLGLGMVTHAGHCPGGLEGAARSREPCWHDFWTSSKTRKYSKHRDLSPSGHGSSEETPTNPNPPTRPHERACLLLWPLHLVLGYIKRPVPRNTGWEEQAQNPSKLMTKTWGWLLQKGGHSRNRPGGQGRAVRHGGTV